MSETEFGFEVRREMTWDEEAYTHTDVPTGNWRVSLPHQCDDWTIADGVSKQEAANALTRFLVEAQKALGALLADQEFGEGDVT